MDPLFPLAKVLHWNSLTISIAAVFIGFGFGFSLERAGFGSAKTLAGVWYGYNFAVIRVMFTAIVVAMLGLFGAYYLGIVDLDLVFVNPTYLWPQIVGGFIFGLGFNLGQYCPGTSLVSVATGKLDGAVFLAGFSAGVLLFTETFPMVEGFYGAGSMGRFLLPDLLHVPAGVVVLGVVCIALGAFALTHVLDRKLGNDRAGR
jgi:uncharacterized protein